MLRANCFTTVVTSTTAQRLERASTNAAPISRRERDRGAVVAIQTALAALNNGYMAGAEIDGAFGRRTETAVEAFQRDYGLIADGVVGRQVMTQLDDIFAGESARAPQGVSLHVGLDEVDPGHYGSTLPLPSCVNDAREMERIAQRLGYDTTRLENDRATTANLAAFMRNAAANLFAGDAAFITFSCHGSQVPNLSADDESDGRDETLCLYDRMLIDDELHALLSGFKEGVRVHLVFDSCHSGTAYKVFPIDPGDMVEAERAAYRSKSIEIMKSPFAGSAPINAAAEGAKATTPIATKSLAAAIEGEDVEQVSRAGAGAEVIEETADVFADLMAMSTKGGPKFVEGVQFYENNKQVYDSVRTAVGGTEREILACTLTAFSAAMDHQTTPAGNPLSLFTFNISQAWSSGTFSGSYSQLHRAVLDRSRPDATPQLTPDGSMGAAARLRERPFAL